MKHIFLLIILTLLPFTLYSAPQYSPLDGFKGGPRIEHKEKDEKQDTPESKTCKVDLISQSSTEIHLFVLENHMGKQYLLNNVSNCMWV